VPTRKQRRRVQKERRHEYETVWVDEEGNELEEPPEEALAPARDKRAAGKAAKAPAKGQQRGSRATRVPPAPSWRRSIKRTMIWVVPLGLVFIWVQSRAKHPSYGSAIVLMVLYAALFPVMTYYIDRFVYRRWESQQGKQPKKR
jgi:hypothetical protein